MEELDDQLDDCFLEENRREESASFNDEQEIIRLNLYSQFRDDHIDRLIELVMNDKLNSWELPEYFSGLMIKASAKGNHTDVKKERIESLVEENNKITNRLAEEEMERELYILRRSEVLGITMSGCAKYSRYIDELKPQIVIIEEAAEILEPMNSAIFTSSLQHLILIGDHKQLRPKVFNYMLERKFNMNISLFERLLENGFEFISLMHQRRMKPQIADFVRDTIYNNKYLDHESVLGLPDVIGIESNIYFINHEYLETSSSGLSSKVNIYEVNYLVQLAKYIVLQGYSAKKITILSFYVGQIRQFKLAIQNEPLLTDVIVSTVDNYQGEENDFILLSLVRSNLNYSLGFIANANRICVALSRAILGMYVIGNLKMIDRVSIEWHKIFSLANERKQVVEAVKVKCITHKTITLLNHHKDFQKVSNGGCHLFCNEKKSCGHVW